MRRAVLPLAMILSLWPVGLIAVTAATGSSTSDSGNEEVSVPVPQEGSTSHAPPKTAKVRLKVSGRTYSCPVGTRARLEPIDRRSATIELRLRAVRRHAHPMERRLRALDKLYPGRSAPRAIADEYNGLLRRLRRLDAKDTALVHQYNRTVDEHNAIIDSVCE